jgi:hypothetical protein
MLELAWVVAFYCMSPDREIKTKGRLQHELWDMTWKSLRQRLLSHGFCPTRLASFTGQSLLILCRMLSLAANDPRAVSGDLQ